MAVEQDWAAYGDQAFLSATDTLLVRTAAGAGAEVSGSHVFGRRTAGGSFIANGGTGAAQTRFEVSTAQVQEVATNAAQSAYADRLHDAAQHIFKVTGTEKARIDSGGRFLAGTAAALGGNTLHEFKTTTAGSWPLTANGNDRGILVSAQGTTSGFYAYFQYNGSINNGSIAWSGSSTSFNTSSDYRLKTDLRPLVGCLDRIKALPVWDFEWTTTGLRGHGFIAHEYGAVVNNGATGIKDGMREEEYEIEPERASNVLGPDGAPVMIPAVMGTRMVPDYQGVDQSKVTPYLVGAVQEMAAIIEDLRERLAVLEGAA